MTYIHIRLITSSVTYTVQNHLGINLCLGKPLIYETAVTDTCHIARKFWTNINHMPSSHILDETEVLDMQDYCQHRITKANQNNTTHAQLQSCPEKIPVSALSLQPFFIITGSSSLNIPVHSSSSHLLFHLH